MQADTLCNLACTYCYLPERALHQPMPLAVATATAHAVNAWAANCPHFPVVWHGGEPLAAGRAALGALMAPFRGVEHQVQTNATLIDDAWCQFFSERHVRVSVSLDGEERLNRHRVMRGFGRPAYSRIVKGVAALRRNGIPFSALCVVSTPRPGLASRLYDYFLELGCEGVGISVEEQEGVNERANDAGDDLVQTFWAELFTAWRRDPRIRVREIDHALNYVGAVLSGQESLALPAAIDPMPMVATDGRVFLLSPELAGFTALRYGDFSSGNILTEPLEDIVAKAPVTTPWIPEFVNGVESCRASCDYFPLCGGANAGNRFFEHGRFDQTRTNHCLNSRIRLLEGILESVGAGDDHCGDVTAATGASTNTRQITCPRGDVARATAPASERLLRAAAELAPLVTEVVSATAADTQCTRTQAFNNWNNRPR